MPTHCSYVHTASGPCQDQDGWLRIVLGTIEEAEFPRTVSEGFGVCGGRRPFNAARIAETLAGPTAAPMVRVSAGTCGGTLVRRRLVPPLMMRPSASNAQ